MFCDKTITIYDTNEGYTDDLGVYHDGEDILIDSFDVDVQPYSSELLYKQYGYKEQVTKRVFMDVDDRVKLGQKVMYKKKPYTIKQIVEWDFHLELMLDDN